MSIKKRCHDCCVRICSAACWRDIFCSVAFWVGIAASIIIGISSFCLVSFDEDKWISMSGIAIGTFILSLVCMNYLTSKSKKNGIDFPLVKNVIDEIEEKIKELKITNVNTNIKITEELKGKISRLKKFSESLSKMVGKIDSLIWKDIEKKLEDLEKEIQIDASSGQQQFEKSRDKLLEKVELLKGYIVLISTTRLTSRYKLALLEEIDENIKDLKNGKDEESKKEIIKLRNRKIEVLSEEPEGVLDKHEIRRSLTISLTVVYFMLLFFTIFNPVTPATEDLIMMAQVTNVTDMSPITPPTQDRNSTDKSPVTPIAQDRNSTAPDANKTDRSSKKDIVGKKVTAGGICFEVTKANVTLTNKTECKYPNSENRFIEIFSYIYWSVIAFYFGSRAIETYMTKKK